MCQRVTTYFYPTLGTLDLFLPNNGVEIDSNGLPSNTPSTSSSGSYYHFSSAKPQRIPSPHKSKYENSNKKEKESFRWKPHDLNDDEFLTQL